MAVQLNDDFTQLGIEDLQPGMVLEKDLYSSRGDLLAPAGTLLTEEKFKSLLRIGVYILAHKKVPINTIGSIPAEKKEEFNTFVHSYVEKEKEVGKCLQQIGNGENIELEKTFELTDHILTRLNNKNDVFLYLNFIKDFDDHTYSHCSNVSLLCNIFGRWMGYETAQIMELTVAGLLHDVGKMGIPLEVLNKTGKLTPEEFAIVKNHSVIGYRLIQQQRIPQSVKLAVLQHHEKMDGSGYPFGIRSSQIGVYGKIVSICDIYDAMTSMRSYHQRRCPFDVIHTFETGLYGELDTELLFLFLNNIAFVYLNSSVILSDGREAEVIFIFEKKPSRPMVKLADGSILNLSEIPELSIERIK
ncbi:MAG: HD-GYP domain-containing protein [Oscillospiraceae bacterium]|nr:HD-GYP domain-containing protein [Oscillospiraceae bacterium]